ncbi:MAG: cob(I)yrinic acid a,c-diamide adenosyltransferase [Desulforhabdus sp.]|jgi:cob(I)alamin adenosyltransferase|nr:cob(I)yrinic acid a,c-diamide adenosyltransferase [Desulforhabdus sp.]
MANHSNKIYTRRGDQGQTSLLGTQVVNKDDLQVKTYGALDELQSHLGLARAANTERELRAIIYSVQKELFIAGAELASTSEFHHTLRTRITAQNVDQLEGWIDRLSNRYGMPHGFVTPGASFASAALHVARAVCRRVERLIVTLNRNLGVHSVLIIYFNRLSDLLFMLAWADQVRATIEQVLDELTRDQPN